jgi:hypothetical protein
MKHRALVLATLPALCPVCDGRRKVRLVRGVQPLTGATPGGGTRCPHCVDQMPVVHLPFRADHPRGDAA